jgi:pyruvate,water dikinase
MQPAASSFPTGAAAVRNLTHVRRLDELSQDDAVTVGHKAANLGALLQAGFPVPPGVVLPTGVPDQALGAAVIEVVTVLGDGPVAVRSSALAEDLDGASFAGQYETVLGVRSGSAILDAMGVPRASRCWCSRWSTRRSPGSRSPRTL